MKTTSVISAKVASIRRHCKRANDYNGEMRAIESLNIIEFDAIQIDQIKEQIFKEGFDTALAGMKSYIDAVTFPERLGEQAPTNKQHQGDNQ